MSDKSRVGVKEQPLTGRQMRSYLSARVVSMVRNNDTTGQFSAQELVHIESLLRDEFQTNQWLLSVCKAATEDAVVVTPEELDLYSKHKSDGEDVCVAHSEAEELKKELDFLKERLHVLKYIHKDLWQKLTQIQSPMRALSDRSDSNETFAKLRIKLTECLEIMKQDLNSNFSVEEPKHIADKIISE
ncbi:unnamed protein product, partial [Oppiella nova]